MIGIACVLGGTFARDDRTEAVGFTRAVRALAQSRGWPVDEARLERTVYNLAWDASPPVDVAQAFSDALGADLSHELADVPCEALFRMAGARALADAFVPEADVAPALLEIAELQMPRVLLAGGWSGIDERKAAAVGWDGPIVLAHDAGAPLGSPAVLGRAAALLGLPADRMWLIGTDARKHIAPARAVGMQTVWLNRTGEPFPLDDPPTATIASFAELLPVLSEPYTRGLLALRYVLRSVLDWRPGHAIGSDAPVLASEPNSDAGNPR